MSSKNDEKNDYDLNLDFLIILDYITDILNLLVDVKWWVMNETTFAWIKIEYKKVAESALYLNEGTGYVLIACFTS